MVSARKVVCFRVHDRDHFFSISVLTPIYQGCLFAFNIFFMCFRSSRLTPTIFHFCLKKLKFLNLFLQFLKIPA